MAIMNITISEFETKLNSPIKHESVKRSEDIIFRTVSSPSAIGIVERLIKLGFSNHNLDSKKIIIKGE